ncbi:hypothetical protein B0H94_1232 [Salsuginibacillus halophilus]|uniref:Uncharacterized protein n=1 Tax=Salsuginibacillus halophilus TaxID=517424 RepID=A0A2P8H3L3_9BACI|nr:hypothetical protein [Salsuginibacillus halophilus]PSL40806.1 hypothetical protein B0H94_1232 [Salsuginibacillus halophilus]
MTHTTLRDVGRVDTVLPGMLNIVIPEENLKAAGLHINSSQSLYVSLPQRSIRMQHEPAKQRWTTYNVQEIPEQDLYHAYVDIREAQ